MIKNAIDKAGNQFANCFAISEVNSWFNCQRSKFSISKKLRIKEFIQSSRGITIFDIFLFLVKLDHSSESYLSQFIKKFDKIEAVVDNSVLLDCFCRWSRTEHLVRVVIDDFYQARSNYDLSFILLTFFLLCICQFDSSRINLIR